MVILLIVLGFLVPVVMVFAYSVWSNRRARERAALKAEETNEPNKTNNDPE